MAYYINTSPTLAGIPQDIINFAVNMLGWVEISSGVIAAPDADAGIGFKVDIATNGPARYRDRVNAYIMKDGGVFGECGAAYVPYIVNNYVSPTRLHLFGATSGPRYIGAAIEFTPGLYRHLYLGYMEKLGNYGGGEIVSGSYWCKNSSRYAYSSTSIDHKYPFGGIIGQPPLGNTMGAMRVVHGELGGEVSIPGWASGNNGTGSFATVNRTLGGMGDNILETALAVGVAPLAGSNLLTPINMFRTLPSARYQPLGRPAGVRMIMIGNIDPAAPISVGGKTWRCFPVFKKGPWGGVGANYSDESSYDIGIAYLED